jgi:hypothetical protein
MEKCNNCRWFMNEMCCNIAVDEIKEDCSHFFSYIESENIKSVDEDTESLINAD